MDEYISKEQIVRKTKSCIIIADDAWESGYNTAMSEMMNWIKHIPAIDVEPVRHGRWIESDFCGLYGIYYRCSVCDLKDEVPTNEGEPLYYYCPWCGAKMDGGVEK